MDKISKRVARAFSRKAKGYSDRADIQSEVAYDLCGLIDEKFYTGNDVMVLDIGCGTGFVAQNFQGIMQVLQLDISNEMCGIASKYGDTVQGDMNDLPFKDGSFDIVISSMAFQWSEDLIKTFSECYRVLNEGGVLCFAVPGEGSLKELKKLFKQLGKDKSINDFCSYDHTVDILELSKFKVIDYLKSDIKIEFDDVTTMLKSFKEIGANISAKGGEILTKSDLKFLNENYSKEGGKNVLTWEIDYVFAKR